MKIIGANITGSFILNNQDVTNTVQSSSAWSGSVASQIDSLNAATASLYAVSASLNSATASLNAATSSLFNATASLFNATSSLNAATSSLNTASASFSSSIASLNTATASFSSSIGLLNGATASLNDATSSLNSATSSLNAATSSLSAATASLSAATASLNSSTASLSAATASLNSATSSLNAATSSLNTATASFSSSIASLNSFTSSQTALNNTFATTGSNNFVGNQVVSGSFTTSGSITATGTITAQTLVVQTITSSVDFVTGSTKFGSQLDNTHVFTGSVNVTGSLTVTTAGTELQVTSTGVNLGNISTDIHNITGSLAIQSGSIVLNTSQSISFNGSFSDNNWKIYRNNTASFTKSLVIGPSLNINAHYDTNEGFAIGGSGGSSYYEILGSSTTTPTHFFRGSVGIGTTNPTSLLEVSLAQNAQTGIRVRNSTSGSLAQVEFGAYTNSGNGGFGKYSTTTTPYKNIAAASTYVYNGSSGDIALLNDASSGNISFAAGGSSTAHMFISASGNVGIGITNPTNTKLHISASVGNAQILSAVEISVTGSGTFQRGVRMLNSSMISGESLLYMVGRNSVAKNTGQMYFYYDGDGSNNNRLSFGLYAVDDIVNITAGGNVGIGTSTPTARFHVSGSTTFETQQNFAISSSGQGWVASFRNASNNVSYIGVDSLGMYIGPSSKGTAIYDGSGANYLYVTSSGVGIGVTTPGYKLHVNGNLFVGTGGIISGQMLFQNGGIGMDRTQNNNCIWFNGGSDTNHALWNDYYGGPTTRGASGSGFDGIKWNVYRGIYIQGGAAGASPCLVIQNSATSAADHTVALYASGTKRFETTTNGIWINDAITSPGNLILNATLNSYIRPASAYWAYVDTGNGISTGASQKIAIGSTTSPDGGLNVRGYGVADSSTAFGVILDRGTKIAWTNAGNSTTGEYIYSQASSPYSITIHSGGYNAFACPNNGNVYIVYEAGNLGVGTDGPSYKLHVNGTAYATGAAGALSDVRHKRNIVSTTKGLNEILALNPVEFEWNEDKIIDSGMEGTHLGFIAQEVKEIIPNTVLTEPNEENTLGLKYNELIPILVKSIQELSTKLDVANAKIAALEAK